MRYRRHLLQRLTFPSVFIFLLTCSSCVRPITPEQPLKTFTYDAEAVTKVLFAYKAGLETEDIKLVRSCFTNDFRSSKHDDVDSLEQKTQEFFQNHEDISVEIGSVDTGDPRKQLERVLDSFLAEEEGQKEHKLKVVVTCSWKIQALAVPSKERYCEQERKRFYLRMENGQWKIESEKLMSR